MGTRGRAVRFQRERGRARGGRAPRGLVVAGEASLDAGPAAVEHDDVLANRHPLPPRARRGSARGAECDWRERVGSTSARRVGSPRAQICPKRPSAPRGSHSIRHGRKDCSSRSTYRAGGDRGHESVKMGVDIPMLPGMRFQDPRVGRVAPSRAVSDIQFRTASERQIGPIRGVTFSDRRSVTRRHPWRSDRRL